VATVEDVTTNRAVTTAQLGVVTLLQRNRFQVLADLEVDNDDVYQRKVLQEEPQGDGKSTVPGGSSSEDLGQDEEGHRKRVGKEDLYYQ